LDVLHKSPSEILEEEALIFKQRIYFFGTATEQLKSKNRLLKNLYVMSPRGTYFTKISSTKIKVQFELGNNGI